MFQGGHSLAIKEALNRSIPKYRGRISARMFQRGHSLAIKQALNRSIPNTEVGSQPACFKENTVTLHYNQNGVLY